MPASPSENLSDDCKAILGAIFGVMALGKAFTFNMRTSRPTERARAALDEAADAGWLSCQAPVDGPLTYVLEVDCGPWLHWLNSNRSKGYFRIVEKIKRRRR